MCVFEGAWSVKDSFASNDMIRVVFVLTLSGNIYTVPGAAGLQHVILNILVPAPTGRAETCVLVLIR